MSMFRFRKTRQALAFALIAGALAGCSGSHAPSGLLVPPELAKPDRALADILRQNHYIAGLYKGELVLTPHEGFDLAEQSALYPVLGSTREIHGGSFLVQGTKNGDEIAYTLQRTNGGPWEIVSLELIRTAKWDRKPGTQPERVNLYGSVPAVAFHSADILPPPPPPEESGVGAGAPKPAAPAPATPPPPVQ